MNISSEKPMDFILEDSMGKLLKWLRILGFSAVLARELQPASAEKAFGAPKTVYLTRSRMQPLTKQGPRIGIQADRVFDQLREVIQASCITREHLRPFSRCIHCNAIIEDIDKDCVQGRVPDYVFATHTKFKCCPLCRRIFWQGTHAQKINAVIDRLLSSPSGQPELPNSD